jgi:MFS family permease
VTPAPEAAPRRAGVVVAVAAAAMVGTLPGRTQGLGLITEPLLVDLGIDRVSYATLNFWATMIGAAGAIGIGRAIDRHGTRLVLAGVAAALGVIVAVMSQAATFAALAVGVTLTRGAGQSALSVVSIAIVGRRFVTRVDAAMAAYSVLLSVGFMIAFPLVGAVVLRSGWRAAWLWIGLALIAGLVPASALLPPKHAEIPQTRDAAGAAGYAWRDALRTGAFWVFALGAALYGLIASGIGLFNESIFAERGFGASVYHQALAVTAITALGGNFLGGWLAGRMRLTRIMAAALVVLAVGLAALPLLASFAQVMAWAVAMGIGGGLVTVLFFSAWPRVFGRRELGRIQGIAQALTVLASAIGPLLLARGVETTGSYAAMFYVLAAAVALTAGAAAVIKLPGAVAESVRASGRG